MISASVVCSGRLTHGGNGSSRTYVWTRLWQVMWMISIGRVSFERVSVSTNEVHAIVAMYSAAPLMRLFHSDEFIVPGPPLV